MNYITNKDTNIFHDSTTQVDIFGNPQQNVVGTLAKGTTINIATLGSEGSGLTSDPVLIYANGDYILASDADPAPATTSTTATPTSTTVVGTTSASTQLTLPIIIGGIVVLAVAGYFIWKFLKKRKGK